MTSCWQSLFVSRARCRRRLASRRGCGVGVCMALARMRPATCEGATSVVGSAALRGASRLSYAAALLGPNRIMSVPNKANVPPNRSQRSGIRPSASHNQNSELAM